MKDRTLRPSHAIQKRRIVNIYFMSTIQYYISLSERSLADQREKSNQRVPPLQSTGISVPFFLFSLCLHTFVKLLSLLSCPLQKCSLNKKKNSSHFVVEIKVISLSALMNGD